MFLDENVFPLFMHVCILPPCIFTFWMELIELFSFFGRIYCTYIREKFSSSQTISGIWSEEKLLIYSVIKVEIFKENIKMKCFVYLPTCHCEHYPISKNIKYVKVFLNYWNINLKSGDTEFKVNILALKRWFGWCSYSQQCIYHTITVW